MHKGFLKAGHLPTLFASFLYFDLSFMAWVLLGPLGVSICAGAGNSGTVLAALFAPGLAMLFGWQSVVGLAAIPLFLTLLVFTAIAKDSPKTQARKTLADYAAILREADAWWFMFFYSVTFGGFVGLASSLTIYFNDQYGLTPVTAGYCTAAVVFVGSMVRPMGGAVAGRIGGVRALTVLYAVASAAFATIATGLSSIYVVMPVFLIGMLCLGMGNGAVFQLVPQRFSKEIGVMTGLAGMTGGVGGFYLASSLGYSRQFTGGYGLGFLIFAVLAAIALLCLTQVRGRWRATWVERYGAARV